MESILECVAQPVWVVDHDGLVVFVNPAGLAALGYDDLSELKGRFGHDAIHYKHRDGSPYPAADCPMTKVRGTGETIHMEEDWFVRRDGTMFPVSYTGTPLAHARRPGCGRRLQGHRGAARGRAGAARARGDPRHGRPAGVGHRRRRAASTTPIRPRWPRSGYAELSDLVGQPAHDTVHYKYPDGAPFPEEDCPLVQARRAGRDAAGHRGLARAQGRLDRARHLLVGAVRAARRAGLGDGVHRRRGAAARAAGRPRPRRRRGAGRGAAGRAPTRSSRPPTPPVRGSSATCTTAPNSSSSTLRSAPAWPATSCPRTPRAAATLLDGRDRAGRGRRQRAARAGHGHPSRRAHPSRPRALRSSAWSAACRCRSTVARAACGSPTGRGRGQRLLLRLRGADQRRQARRTPTARPSASTPPDGRLIVEVADDGAGGADLQGGSGLSGLMGPRCRAGRRRSRSRARAAPAPSCAPRIPLG